MLQDDWIFRRGDLYLADLGDPGGSKQGGLRPVVILQNNRANHYAPTVTLAPLTSNIEKKYRQPTHYYLEKAKGLSKPSTVLTEQIETLDKKFIIRYLGRVSAGQMRGIERAVKTHLDLHTDRKSNE